MAKNKFKEISEALGEQNEEAILFDGYEDCLIGICKQFGRPPVACYDRDKCIQTLMTRDGMDHEEAEEFFEFNTIGSGLGESTPVFVNLFT